MMRRYETLILATPEITQDEVKSVQQEVNQAVTGCNGLSISFERWGKYKLCYPVNKKEYGVYFLARYEVPNEHAHTIVDVIKTLCAVKLHTTVMRHVTCILDPKKPLTYQRPRSLEEMPVESEMEAQDREGAGQYTRGSGSHFRERRESSNSHHSPRSFNRSTSDNNNRDQQ